MAGEGCQNALFAMLVRFYGSSFSPKIFSDYTMSDLEIFAVHTRARCTIEHV